MSTSTHQHSNEMGAWEAVPAVPGAPGARGGRYCSRRFFAELGTNLVGILPAYLPYPQLGMMNIVRLGACELGTAAA